MAAVEEFENVSTVLKELDADLWTSIIGDQEVKNPSDSFLPVVISNIAGSYKHVLLGHLLPAIIALTAILNGLVFSILIKPKMRSSVNVILAALAISDTLTGLTALPYYAYFYSAARNTDYVPYHWCYVQKLCSGILPTIFHTISVWLTLTLATQRYIYLCHSLRAKTLCTVNGMVKVSVAVVIVSFLVHSPRLFDSTFVSISLYSEDGTRIDTCVEILQDWTERFKHIYFPAYYWVRLVAVHLVPTAGLIILNTILIAVIRGSSQRRRRLLLQNRSGEWRRTREANYTTLLLVVVVTVFVIVEVPMGLLMLFTVLKNQYDVKFFEVDGEQQELLATIFNFLILLSYPTNFFIYVCMSKQFRSRALQFVTVKRRARVDTEKTLPTVSTRDKSSSIELMKSIFTVTAVPLVKHNRKSSATPSNLSAGSTLSSTRAPSLVTVKMADTNRHGSCTSLQSGAECLCLCPICMTECKRTY